MAAVNWYGAEKVIDQSFHTFTLTNDVMQKSYVIWEQLSKKKKQNAIFQKISTFYFKMLLKHKYLLEKSYIKMIPTISSIH